MRGTGRFNVAQGAVATAQGIGATSSGLAAGLIVDHFGYSVAFAVSAAIATAALGVLLRGMPETTSNGSTKAQPAAILRQMKCQGALTAQSGNVDWRRCFRGRAGL
jgi:MFS family permease